MALMPTQVLFPPRSEDDATSAYQVGAPGRDVVLGLAVAGQHFRPLVVVSLSTTYQAQESLVRNVIGAVGRLPVRALITAGPVHVPGQPGAAQRAYRPVRSARLGPAARGRRCDARWARNRDGGIRHGLPLVCLPMWRDQGDVAARVAW